MTRIGLTLARVGLALVLYALGAVVLGLASFPAVLWCVKVWGAAAAAPLAGRILAVSVAAGFGYFLFGFSLMFLTVLLRWLLCLNLKEGEHPLDSPEALKWFVSNALQLLVWTLFGNFLLLTPFASLYYRLMGAKLGLNVQINSAYCADLQLLEIGDNSVIGGHATVIAHSVERQGLILKKVRIGRNVVVGLNSVVLPGVEIGEGAVIAAGAIVPKYTQIPAKSFYGIRDAGSR